MSNATISIIGLYNYDPTIFDNLHVPTAMETDKQTVIDNILMDCAEFEILYADSDFMKFAIDKWSAVLKPIWEHLYETTQYEYDPISNYDRTEKWTDDDNRKITNDRTADLKDELTNGLTNTQAQNSYENAGMVDALKSTNSGKDTTTHTGTDKYTEQHSGKVTRDGHAYGNIGVTTTQEMITQEREIAVFSVINTIVSDFKMRFCLMIY